MCNATSTSKQPTRSLSNYSNPGSHKYPPYLLMLPLSTVLFSLVSPFSDRHVQHARWSSRCRWRHWGQCPQEQTSWHFYGWSFPSCLLRFLTSCFFFKTAFAAFGGILFGYDTGTISGLQQMPDWLRTFGHPVPVSSTFPDGYGISSSQRSLVVSILSAGTFFGPFYHPAIFCQSSDFIYLGALAAAPIADIIGRKWGIVVSCLVFSVGIAIQTASTAIAPFVVGRAWAGLGVGLVSTLVPMYQSECSPKWIRGAIVGLYQFGITIGILLAAIFNNATKNRPNHSSYRIPVALQFIWAAILAAGMTFLPEVCISAPALELRTSEIIPVTSLADQEPS